MDLPENTVVASIDGIGPEPWPIQCQECDSHLSLGEKCDHFIVTNNGVVEMNL